MRLHAVVVFFAATSFAAAQVQVDAPSGSGVEASTAIQRCLEIENRLSRLSCYDAAAGYETAADPGLDTGTGGWQFVEAEDDFTNADRSFVFLSSDRAGAPLTDAPVRLIVRCDGDGGNEIIIVSGGYIGARNNRIPVRYRFGEDAPVSESWSESTDGTAAFLPRGYSDFRNGLNTLQDFVFEVTDYRGSRYSANFVGLGENSDMLEFVLDGCA